MLVTLGLTAILFVGAIFSWLFVRWWIVSRHVYIDDDGFPRRISDLHSLWDDDEEELERWRISELFDDDEEPF